jgi:hypothetical protein
MLGVIAFAADQKGQRRRRGQERCCALDAGNLSAGQEERVRTAFFIDERVDFRPAPAARTADGLAPGIIEARYGL